MASYSISKLSNANTAKAEWAFEIKLVFEPEIKITLGLSSS